MPTQEISSPISSLYTPVDIESIKKKLQELTTTNKRQNLIWRPPVGETLVRIVPYRHGKTPFNELLFHFEIGNRKQVTCAANFAKSCPICDFAEELRKKRTKEDFQAFKKIAAKIRTYIPVIIRGREEEGVKFWGISKEVYETLLNFFNNPEYGDITHPTEGIDITVKFTGPNDKLKYGKSEVFPRRNSSPLHKDRDMIIKILKDVPNVFEIFPEISFEELKRTLDSALNPSEGTTSEVTNVEVNTQEEPVKNLDKEFDDLFKTS